MTLLLALLAVAQARPRVVIVESDELPPYEAPVAAFQEALGEPSAVVDLHGREAEADALVARLKADPPALVLCLGAKAAWAVHQGLPDVPMVYASILDPDRYGLAGANVTGVRMTVNPVGYLSQFSGFFPDAKRIGFLRGPHRTDEEVAALKDAAAAAGLELVVADVASPRGVRKAFADLAPDVDALWLPPDRDILDQESFRMVSEEATRRRIPLLVDTENMVKAGGLFAVIPDADGMGRQAADLARQILAGASPADVAVQYPDAVLVALNTKTLEVAGIPFDKLMLDFVDRKIE